RQEIQEVLLAIAERSTGDHEPQEAVIGDDDHKVNESSKGLGRTIRCVKALGIRQFDHHWTLPSRLADSSLPWLIEVNGLVVDARQLPVAIQEVAVQKGLIPSVYQPSDQEAIEPPS
ncbi:MAG TPA: hypothetical protein VMI52_10005, partial [Acetobacteraceae bacterium]|nr:hypothetical protein [Acetobacteraceae bacterium]